MKINQTITLILLSIILVSGSCVSRKKLTYLKYPGKPDNFIVSAKDYKLSITPADYKIMPYDNLFIRVLTPDPQWSALFNIDVGTGGLNQESAGLSGYSVDIGGNIEIPFVGKVNVGGNTLPEIKFKLDSVFKNYVTDASLTVRLVNNYVSVIGEVNSPGRHGLSKDRMNIFEVLALAGDMTPYSNRQKVQLIRPTPYGPVIKEFSLSDRNILSSEFYYIMPNDIIYAMPLSGRPFQVNSSVWSILFGTISSALGIIAIFRTF
jgi:polysaccharide biosynthesis/export protein